jgi:hypothetical protein
MPVSEGGLGIINPIMDLLTVCDNVDEEPSKAFAEWIQKILLHINLQRVHGLGEASSGCR